MNGGSLLAIGMVGPSFQFFKAICEEFFGKSFLHIFFNNAMSFCYIVKELDYWIFLTRTCSNAKNPGFNPGRVFYWFSSLALIPDINYAKKYINSND